LDKSVASVDEKSFLRHTERENATEQKTYDRGQYVLQKLGRGSLPIERRDEATKNWESFEMIGE